jgi:uncharacterized protein YukE
MTGEEIRKLVDSVNKDQEKCQTLLKDLNQVEKHLQSLCTHHLVYDGHDSHYDLYKCKWCGYEERG